jgi:hypothetical protein
MGQTAFQQGFITAQFVVGKGLVVSEVKLQAVAAQAVGQQNFRCGSGFADPFGL